MTAGERYLPENLAAQGRVVNRNVFKRECLGRGITAHLAANRGGFGIAVDSIRVGPGDLYADHDHAVRRLEKLSIGQPLFSACFRRAAVGSTADGFPTASSRGMSE